MRLHSLFLRGTTVVALRYSMEIACFWRIKINTELTVHELDGTLQYIPRADCGNAFVRKGRLKWKKPLSRQAGCPHKNTYL